MGYVGLLLEHALAESWGAVRVVPLNSASAEHIGARAAARFAFRLLCAQLRPPPLPVLFNHIGIARAQRRLPRWLRRPYAVFVHGIEIWDPALGADRKRVVRDAALRLSNSAYTAERVTRTHPDIGPIRPCPLALLPGEPMPTDADRMAADASLPPGRRVVIVGRMSASERYKGHDALIECWPRVIEAVPDARLIVVGRGDDLPRLTARARELGVADAVRFTGFLDDVAMRATLAVSDVFAMPSSGEGFGLAYLEAMRAGLPCIGSDADAAVDVVEHGRTGLLVPAGQRDALADALVALLTDETTRRRMGEAGRGRERTVFGFDNFQACLHAEMSAVARGLQMLRTDSRGDQGHRTAT